MREFAGATISIVTFCLGKIDFIMPALQAMSFAVSIATGAVTTYMAIKKHYDQRNNNRQDDE